ncbi:hypothetical protein AAVH_02101 [Aphelenchoides avenae]|nr:hypothetical protein AAVH_02101 [Aphelenchus avenae]
MESDKKNNFTRTAANLSRTLSELNKALKKQYKYTERRSTNRKRKPEEVCSSSERRTPEKKPRPALQKQPSAFVVKQTVVASKDEIAGLALRKLSEGKHPQRNRSPTSSDFTAIPTSSPESKSETAAEHALRPLKLLISKKQLEETTKSESEEVDDEPLKVELPVEEEVDAEEIGAIFSKTRTSHGRNVRPSMKIAGLVKADSKEQLHGKRKGFMTKFSEDEKRKIRQAELAAEAECSAYEPTEKKTAGSAAKSTAPPRPSVIQMAPASVQKKKKPSTVKQRLASKLGLKG